MPFLFEKGRAEFHILAELPEPQQLAGQAKRLQLWPPALASQLHIEVRSSGLALVLISGLSLLSTIL